MSVKAAILRLFELKIIQSFRVFVWLVGSLTTAGSSYQRLLIFIFNEEKYLRISVRLQEIWRCNDAHEKMVRAKNMGKKSDNY